MPTDREQTFDERQDDDWQITYEHVDPQDPIIAGPSWRDALREIAATKSGTIHYSKRLVDIARRALGEA